LLSLVAPNVRKKERATREKLVAAELPKNIMEVFPRFSSDLKYGIENL